MTTNLPKGIVTNSTSLSGNIQQIDTVSVDDIYKLWRGTERKLLFSQFWRPHANYLNLQSTPQIKTCLQIMSDEGWRICFGVYGVVKGYIVVSRAQWSRNYS
jgi:hypothetical protein